VQEGRRAGPDPVGIVPALAGRRRPLPPRL